MTQTRRLCLVLGDELKLYSFPEPHPFRSDRYEAFLRRLRGEGLDTHPGVTVCGPRMASRDEVELFHDPDYVEFVARVSKGGVGYLDYGDTPAFPGVYEASLWVVGATLRALEAVLSGESLRAFNPVGGLHHARRNRAAGFCVFNDVGVALEFALRAGVERILYVDVDAHHGDGVFYGFYADPRVWIFDVHEDGRYLYPGTGFRHEVGEGEARGTKLNVPLPPGAGDDELAEAAKELAEFADRAEPELVVLQAGADGLAADPLTHLSYTASGYLKFVEEVVKVAEKHARGRILAVGGGGYSREALASAWVGLLRKLLGRT